MEPLIFDEKSYYDGDYRTVYTPTPGKSCTPEQMFSIYALLQGYRLKIIKPILSKNKRILDIGCSSGAFLNALNGLVKERVGLDLDKSSARFASEKIGVKVYTMPLEKTDLPKEYFDVVFMLSILEHTKDPLGFLKQAKKYLKPDGHICVEVPNYENFLLSIYKLEEFRDFYFVEPHLFYFSPKTLAKVMHKAGFRGKIYMCQRYNIMNYMHWIFTKTPQSDPVMGMSEPIFFKERISGKIKIIQDLNFLIKKFDRYYKNILVESNVSDVMFFMGQLK